MPEPPAGTRRLTIRLPGGDAERLAALAAALGVTRSEAVRRCIRDARPVVVSTGDADAIRECNRLLVRAGGNLNQVARSLNSGAMSPASAEDVSAVNSAVTDVAMAVAVARETLVVLSDREGARVREALARDRA